MLRFNWPVDLWRNGCWSASACDALPLSMPDEGVEGDAHSAQSCNTSAASSTTFCLICHAASAVL